MRKMEWTFTQCAVDHLGTLAMASAAMALTLFVFAVIIWCYGGIENNHIGLVWRIIITCSVGVFVVPFLLAGAGDLLRAGFGWLSNGIQSLGR